MRVAGWRAPAAAVLVLAASGGVGYRVFAPAEVETPASTPYPAATAARPGVTGELPRAPLVVDGRLRVYAAKRQVWADAPIGARTETTPYWSLRRWPQQVVGVAAAGRLVVSRWSDGTLVAIEARTGSVAWRARGPVGPGGYVGRRTGAATVYRPPGLFVTVDAVVVSTAAEVRGYDPATGTPLWTNRTPTCRTTEFVGPGFYAELIGCADADPVLRRIGLRTGRQLPDWRPPRAPAGWTIEPLGCALAGTGCAGARAGARGWRFAGDEIRPAPGLDAPGTWMVGDLAVTAQGAGFAARDAGTGAPQWTWQPGRVLDATPARIVAAEPGAIYLVTDRHTLVVLAPADGLERSRLSLERSAGPERWTPGHVYAADRYLVVERLAEHPDAAAGDTAYYAGLRPVLVSGT